MKSIKFFLIAIYLVIAEGFPSYAIPQIIANDGMPIVIVNIPNELGDAPRGPVLNPFSAYQLNNQVTLESSVPFGLVSVSLSSTAGDYYTTVFDTEDGFIFIPISGLAGNYTLLLTTQSGPQYHGEFEITQ